MRSTHWIRALFLLVALYDGLLGLLFLVAPLWPFDHFNVTPPNHIGYVQFPAALLLIFALMFLQIAISPVRHRHLIPYGIMLKVAYVGLSGWHWWSAGIPGMWKPFTVIDAVTAVLFVAAYASLWVRSNTI
jgi:hypothetical protein